MGLLRLLVTRLEADWVALPAKQRRPWNQKEVEPPPVKISLDERGFCVICSEVSEVTQCFYALIFLPWIISGNDASLLWRLFGMLGSIHIVSTDNLCGCLPH